MTQRQRGATKDARGKAQRTKPVPAASGGRSARSSDRRSSGGNPNEPQDRPSKPSGGRAQGRREEPSEPPISTNGPAVKAWLDANLSPQPGSGRDPFRVPAELA